MPPISFFDDFTYLPLMYQNRRKRTRPLLTSLYDSLEDQFDQRVGRIFRNLPSLLVDLESREPARKKKMLDSKPKCQALVSTKDNRFRVELDTSSFSPDDLSVKVVGDKLTVSGRRETRAEDCYEYHEMHREFTIPEDVDPDTVTSKLSNSGELTIEAPMKSIKESPAGRTVIIQRETSEENITQMDKKTDPSEGGDCGKPLSAK